MNQETIVLVHHIWFTIYGSPYMKSKVLQTISLLLDSKHLFFFCGRETEIEILRVISQAIIIDKKIMTTTIFLNISMDAL